MSQKLCFVIAPIGEPNTDTRKRSDQVLKHVISPAVNECGYQAIRADQISEPGIITSQVIQHEVDDPIVLADLTERNPNVFYELAIRHVIKKPLVQIIKRGEPLPFDVAGTRTIQVDHRDLDSVEEAKREIINQIRAVEKSNSEIDTPISVSLNLQMLRQSENPEQRSLADVVSAISEMRASMQTIEKKFGDPFSLLPIEYIERLITKAVATLIIPDEISDIADELDSIDESSLKETDRAAFNRIMLLINKIRAKNRREPRW